MTTTLLEACFCGSTRKDELTLVNLPMIRCCDCGTLRQNVAMSEKELGEWYARHYFEGHYTHTYMHDKQVAKLRLINYQITPGAKLLDVGSGNGAFVSAARGLGIDAWGQDLAESSEGEYVYRGDLESIAFPTDEFDVVTVHDVLEHMLRPADVLREIRRILKRPGKLFLDFPRFHHETGSHHWKAVEHLWMFHEHGLAQLVRSCGFHVTRISHPIPSKILIEAEPIAERRPQILTPAGIGDAWWVMTKLPGFLKQHGLGMPDVWVQDSGGPKRTQPFLRTLPMIHGAGYKVLSDRNAVFHEAYVQNGRTVYANAIEDIDYFIAYNGIMRAGRSLEETDLEFGCEWRPRMHISKAAIDFRNRLAGGGEYIVSYWAEAGMYRAWLAQFPSTQIIEALEMIERELDVTIVFIGAPWDRGQIGRVIAQARSRWIDLIGSTSYDQMLGALMGAKAVIGYPAGNTLLATYFNTPTLLFWNEYFDKRFWTNSAPKDARYSVLDTRDCTPKKVLKAMLGLLGR